MRYRQYLRERYRWILGYSGTIWVIIALLILSPLLALPFFPEERPLAAAFAGPGLLLLLAGVLARRLLPAQENVGLSILEGSVIVVLTWTAALVVGAIPLVSGVGLTPTQALFESTSGWTTTGLSVLDVDQTPALVLLYRSITQLAGGAGFAIIILTALAGPVGMGLSSAEGRGEQLEPHVRQSASIVLRLYSVYVLLGILALRGAGMSWFDAVNHAFAALSTGGFSTRSASLGYWDSPLLEAVTIVLMLLGTINFLISYAALKGKWRAFLRSSEVHVLGVMIAVGVLVLGLGVTRDLYPTPGKALRVALFESVSAISTTGFATVSYLPWPGLGWFTLTLFMLIGGGSGSTAGGIKQARVYVLAKSLWWQIRGAFQPRNTLRELDIWQGEERRFLGDAEVRVTAIFVFTHLAVFVLGAGILIAYGYDVAASLFEFASAISTIGLSVGVTSADAPAGVLWAMTAGMFLGRLEFFAVFTGVAKLLVDGRWLILPRGDP
ncbi:MAG: TrkH family potassium uptake protein [Caldilineae bacterium]|nr:MAG: TrkH family potassium uptake protein [Caldilineae bacterium]